MSLTHAEGHRWLQTAKHDRWYREQCRMTAANLAAAMQIKKRMAVYLIAGQKWVRDSAGEKHVERGTTRNMLVKLEQIIDGVECGTLVFWRKGHAWINPVSAHGFAQRSLTEARHWNYWRPCLTCGGRKWLPIWMNGGGAERDQAWVACYRCSPPSQWPSFGAVARDEILAAQVVPEILSAHGDRRSSQLAMPEQAVRQ